MADLALIKGLTDPVRVGNVTMRWENYPTLEICGDRGSCIDVEAPAARAAMWWTFFEREQHGEPDS